jgi:hypothetical protein
MKRFVFSVCVPIALLLVFSASVLANNFVVGSSSNVNVVVPSSDNWTVIRSATVNIPLADGAAHGCVATASADVYNPGPAGVENQYRFVLTRNNTNPVTNAGSERLLELVDNEGVNDPDYAAVATTQHFTGLTNDTGPNGTGSHTFYFLGRKVAAADTDTSVVDASLSVMCLDTP